MGTGVAKLLLDEGDRTARHAGRTLWLEHIVDTDLSRARDVDLPKDVLTDDLSADHGQPGNQGRGPTGGGTGAGADHHAQAARKRQGRLYGE